MYIKKPKKTCKCGRTYKFVLEVMDISYEGAILNAIKQAHIDCVKVVKIGLPKYVQKEITKDLGSKKVGMYKQEGLKIKEIFGIKVVNSRTLQITTEFSRFIRK